MPISAILSRRRAPVLDHGAATTRSASTCIDVALVGVDLSGAAPGGMASISRTLVKQFAGRTDVRVTPITNFDEGSMLRRLYVGFRAAVQIATYRNKLDLVHLQVADGWSIERDLFLVLAAKIRRFTVVAQFHGAGQIADYENGNILHKFAYRLLTRSCYNLALGETALNWLKLLGNTENSEIVPNGVAVCDLSVPLPSGKPHLVFVGRLGLRKGIFDLLDAAEVVASDGFDFCLDIVGDGDIGEVEARVQSSSLLVDRVSVHGWVSEEKVRTIILNSRALVLPSYAEGLPMAILEAMAMGRPVIATNVGEVPMAVQDGVNGILIEAGNIAALTKSITKLLSDCNYAEGLGTMARSTVIERFSEDALTKKLEIIYRALSSGRIPNPSEFCIE